MNFGSLYSVIYAALLKCKAPNVYIDYSKLYKAISTTRIQKRNLNSFTKSIMHSSLQPWTWMAMVLVKIHIYQMVFRHH